MSVFHHPSKNIPMKKKHWPEVLRIYLEEAARRKCIGKSLLSALIEASEDSGLWTLQAGIFPENTASIALHKSLGFREVGRRERIGRMRDTWRDVVLLERRSARAGV